ncbi:MAG: hypothetical protein V2J25_08060 [Desulfatiglans sp.]|jgi:hypothetical protein|nr:hypothetical protein [Thermodesulfobacteriota bacterium]MEE4352807.1 hypothetical protein [Desulfatiglans sp.]
MSNAIPLRNEEGVDKYSKGSEINPDTTRIKRIQDLKTKAGEIQDRRDLLKIQIREIQREVPPALQWKVFV